jgi:predicted FMN-binding regulatory protein PaiB
MDPDRRSLLTAMLGGMALLGPDAAAADAAAQSEPPDPSVYIPKAHLVQDRAFLHAFMDEFSFVDLVTTTPTLRITHIPSVLDRAAGAYGTIVGHISAANDQVKAIRAGARAVVVFRGPHGYVSPGWLATPAGRNGVPTWNFAVVHATGRLKAIDEPAQKHALLSSLIRKYETAIGGTAYDFAALPMDDVLARAKGKRSKGSSNCFRSVLSPTSPRRCRSLTSTGSGRCARSQSTSTRRRRSNPAGAPRRAAP